MDLSARFDLWRARLPASPADAGRVEGLVVRPADGAPGERHTPDALRVSPEAGVEGDRWRTASHGVAGNQVSLINVNVLRSLAGDDAARMALSGDNLQVDLDLSEANLPVGTLLSIGDAVLRVSDEPHRPCRHFAERFGAAAAKRVARANRTGHRGRGVLCAVVRAGTIRRGDAIAVERPGAA